MRRLTAEAVTLPRQPNLAILGVGTNTRVALGNRGRLDVMEHN